MSLESRSLGSSTTEGDLEEARQRLLEHQYDHEYHTDPVNEVQPTLAVPHRTRLPPTPLRDGNYGSVTTLQSIQQKPAPRIKRYRIPFLILLAFDFGMVIFLSIICSEVHVHVACVLEHEQVTPSYAPVNVNPDYPPHREGWGL